MTRRPLLLAIVLLAALAPAAGAATTRDIDLPKLFATQLERAHAQTDVPILLPQTMRSDFERHFPEGRARPRAWRFDIGAARDCNQATACFVAEFKAVARREAERAPDDPARARPHRLLPAALLRRVLLAAEHRVARAPRALLDPGEGRQARAAADGQLGHPHRPALTYWFQIQSTPNVRPRNSANTPPTVTNSSSHWITAGVVMTAPS